MPVQALPRPAAVSLTVPSSKITLAQNSENSPVPPRLRNPGSLDAISQSASCYPLSCTCLPPATSLPLRSPPFRLEPLEITRLLVFPAFFFTNPCRTIPHTHQSLIFPRSPTRSPALASFPPLAPLQPISTLLSPPFRLFRPQYYPLASRDPHHSHHSHLYSLQITPHSLLLTPVSCLHNGIGQDRILWIPSPTQSFYYRI